VAPERYDAPSAMQVFLIHGMGRTRASMALLERRLAGAGHEPSSFGYRVMRDDLADIAEAFRAHVARAMASKAPAPYAVVGHSLGNVITRLCSAELPEGFARFVMLAPPNRSPALARAMRKSRLFALLTRDAGRKLGDREFFARLPIPDVPTLVIAGRAEVPLLPFRGAASDGIVGVHETRLPGARHELVDAAHTFIMNDRRATRLLLEFLEADPRSRSHANQRIGR
jgi:pimeloyl-ACP methyl ester carboxylesterase